MQTAASCLNRAAVLQTAAGRVRAISAYVPQRDADFVADLRDRWPRDQIPVLAGGDVNMQLLDPRPGEEDRAAGMVSFFANVPAVPVPFQGATRWPSPTTGDSDGVGAGTLKPKT